MIIVPGTPPVQQTRHSREISKKVEQLVRDYQRANPDVKDSDVHAALVQLASAGDSSAMARRKRAIGVGFAAAIVAAFTAMASTGGGQRFDTVSMMWVMIGVVAAIGGIVIAAIRFARRN